MQASLALASAALLTALLWIRRNSLGAELAANGTPAVTSRADSIAPNTLLSVAMEVPLNLAWSGVLVCGLVGVLVLAAVHPRRDHASGWSASQ